MANPFLKKSSDLSHFFLGIGSLGDLQTTTYKEYTSDLEREEGEGKRRELLLGRKGEEKGADNEEIGLKWEFRNI